jgi:hypothetical protein
MLMDDLYPTEWNCKAMSPSEKFVSAVSESVYNGLGGETIL